MMKTLSLTDSDPSDVDQLKIQVVRIIIFFSTIFFSWICHPLLQEESQRALNQTLTDLKNEYAVLENGINDLENDFDNLENGIGELESDIHDLNIDVAYLENNETTLSAKIVRIIYNFLSIFY